MKISTILDNVEFRQLALPEFQRGYVWSRDQVRGLMSSLYRHYPVGSLLVWTTDADRSMMRGEGTAGVVKLLLDGQQRITSLYGIVKGHAPAFFQGNEKAFTDLYFDARSEVFEFYGPVKMREDPFWISVSELFRSDLEDVLQRLSGNSADVRELVTYQTRLGRVLQIRDIELHVEEITGKERTIDEVVEIFNRVNSGGTKLSAGDLALARICADWPKARAELRRLLTRWSDAGFDFKQEWLLRCATAIATDQAPFSSLRSVSVEEFAMALKNAEQAINFLLNLVGDRLGMDHDRVLAGRYAFAALARFLAESGGRVDDSRIQQRMLYWYVCSFLWGRYSGSTETVLQRDLDALDHGGIDGLIDELARWRGSLSVRPEDFNSWSVGARFYPLLYVLSRIGGARDLGNGLQLSAGMLGANSKLQIHHIFPKARLYEAGYDRPDVNALGNFCFLTAGSNLQISASDPASYLAQIESERPGVLASQWIPVDPSIWRVDRYPDFLDARRDLLAEAANEMLDSLRAGEQVDGAEKPRVTREAPVALETSYEEDPELEDLVRLAIDFGIAAPEVNFEITDDESGEILAMADLAWPDGIQPGLTEPVAFLLERDEEMESRLGELGYRFFLTKDRLIWHIEEIVGIDIDGDEIVGSVEAESMDDGRSQSDSEGAEVFEMAATGGPATSGRSWSHDEIRRRVEAQFLLDAVDRFDEWLLALPGCEVRHLVNSNHSVYRGRRRVLFFYFAERWMYFRLPRATESESDVLQALQGGITHHPRRRAISGRVQSDQDLELLKTIVEARVIRR